MQKSKLTEIFYSLNPWQQVALSKFVASPYFNKREDIIKLCAYLQQIDIEKKPQLLQKELAYKHIFGEDSVFDAQKMRYAMSYLLQAIERFLVIEELEKDKIKTQTTLAKVYRNLNLPKSYTRHINKAKKMLEQSSYRDEKWWENNYALAFDEYLFFVNQKRVEDHRLQNLLDTLNIQIILKTLKNACFTFFHKQVSTTSYDMGLLTIIVEYIKTKPDFLLAHPYIALYYNYYCAIEFPKNDYDYFKKFRQGLAEMHLYFNKTEQSHVYTFAMNFAMSKINAGESTLYDRELHEIHLAALKQEVLFHTDKRFNHLVFVNVVMAGLRVKEYEWVKKFIVLYRDKLLPSRQDFSVKYCLAMMDFELKKYDNVILLLRDIELNQELLLFIGIKMLLLRTYYELGEFSVLESFLDAFEKFLTRRRKVLGSGYYQLSHSFIKLTRKLFKAPDYDEVQKKRLEQAIQESPTPLSAQKWLLEKLAEA